MRIGRNRRTRTCRECQGLFTGSKYSKVCWECKYNTRTKYYQDKIEEKMILITKLRYKIIQLEKKVSRLSEK